jgi:hypothetical protein
MDETKPTIPSCHRDDEPDLALHHVLRDAGCHLEQRAVIAVHDPRGNAYGHLPGWDGRPPVCTERTARACGFR